MRKVKIGIVREEGRIPPDKRVPLNPLKCQETLITFPNVEIIVQPSAVRSYTDQEYRELGIPVQEDLTGCDILMGVKEVPIADLIPDKTYLFFSHTIKKQPHNRQLLQAILTKNNTLIDYELLTNEKGERLVAFGFYAGVVGAYNGLMAYGRKWNLYSLKPAWQCVDKEDMEEEYFKVKTLPPVKIAVTGGGRVAGGAMEVLNQMGIRKVSVFDYLYKEFPEPVYAQLRSSDYNMRRDGKVWDNADFYAHSSAYKSTFDKFYPVTDILMAAAYWNPAAPALFTPEEMQRPDFKINTIADITCDINGSVPTTKRASTILEPFYDYNPITHQPESAFSKLKNITVMAVDNLPCELPRSASRDFGRQLIDAVFPHLFGNDNAGIIERATIVKKGKLTSRYEYLQDYAGQG